MAGRQGHHLRRLPVRHLADLRHRRHHRWPELRDPVPGHPQGRQGRLDLQGPVRQRRQGPGRRSTRPWTCSGNTITFHLNKPVGDFNYALYLPAFAPYRKDQDKGDKSNYAVFSSGPYKLQGTWTKNKGGTFVRNPNWDPKTDPVRKANPDQITFTEGLSDEVIAQRLISDQGNDKSAVSDRRIVPSFQPQVLNNPQLKSRSELVDAPYVDYLVPNFKTLTNPLVRQALGVATDKAGYITAQGGQTYGRPAQTLVNPSVLGYKDFNAFNAPDAGDPAKAKQLLTQAGVKMPYPINFTYSGGTPTSQKYAAALKAGWEKAGFKVTLNELTDTYYDVIQNPSNAKKYDVTWAGWGADWPSASTVIPPLFDSRVNLSVGLQRPGLRLLRQRRRSTRRSTRRSARPTCNKQAPRGATSTSSSPRTSPTSRWPTRSSS